MSGLSAKPKIDIVAEVKNLAFDHQLLTDIGYNYRGSFNLPFRKSFMFRSPEVSVNIHIFEENDPEVELNLKFRDYLRNNPLAKAEYQALKYQLLEDDSAHQKNGRMYVGYTLGKNHLIQKILEACHLERPRITFCTHDAEWQSAKDFRNTYFFSPHHSEDPYTWTFDHKDHKHFMFYKGVKMIGYAHLQLWPDNQAAALRVIVIDQASQHQGLGVTFLSLIEKWLRLQSYRTIHVQSNKAAITFYQNAGYKNMMPFNDPDGYASSAGATDMGKILT